MTIAVSEEFRQSVRQSLSPNAALALLNEWVAKMNALGLTHWRQQQNQSFKFQLMATKALSDSFLIGTTLNGSVFLGIDNELGWMLDVPWRRVFMWQDNEMSYMALASYIDFTPFALVLQANPKLIYQATTKKFEMICLSELKKEHHGLSQNATKALPLMLKNLFTENEA